jgi:hypothetical protein
MLLLKQSTAVNVLIGPFVDDADGKTAETGLTISQADVRLSKNAGNMAQKGDATSCTHDELGYYSCPLSTTDTGTLGRLKLMVHESGALPVWHEFMVVPANVYDSLVGGTDYLQVDIEQVDGDGTAAANLNSACDNYSATRGLAGTALPDAAADAAGGLPISDAGGLDLDTQIGTDIDAILADTDELQANQGDWATAVGFSTHSAADAANAVWDETATGHTDAGKAGAQLWTDIDAILEDTNELQTDDVPGLIAALNDLSSGDIDTSVSNQLAAQNLDHLIKSAVDTNFATTVHEDSVVGQLAQRGGANLFDRSTDSLEAIINTEPLGTAMRGTDSAALASVCTEGRLSELDAGNLPSDIDAILGDTNELQTDDVPGLIAALNDISAADVWDATEAITGNTLSFETIMARLYRFFMNKMNITDATGEVALRNEADNGDIMTNTITDNDTTTTRTAGSWA